MSNNKIQQNTIALFLILFIIASKSTAQSYFLNIAKRDGTTNSYPIEEIQKITFDNIVAIEDQVRLQNVVQTFMLLQNYPNPFNPNTTLEYKLAKSGKIDIIIFDIRGRTLRNLISANQLAGTYRIQWDGKNDNGQFVANGMYIYQIRQNGQALTKKMTLLK